MSARVYHIEVLKRELDRRKETNPRFSLRAFAKKLRMHPSALSRVLSRKQPLSPSAALIIIEELGLDPSEQVRFLRSVTEERQQQEWQKLARQMKTGPMRHSRRVLNADEYAQVLSLAAHAILQVTFVSDFQSDDNWIAERLNLPVAEVRSTIETLLEIGLLCRDEDGRLRNHNRKFTTEITEETEPLRLKHQVAVAHAASVALRDLPDARRVGCDLTLTVDPSKIEATRKLMDEFLERLAEHLEADEPREVYQLAINLFPLQR